ncbi:MAG: hypothetical protein AB1656_17280 [Candidatus Omnitrophota bacterium]
MCAPYEIIPYTIDDLKEILAKKSGADPKFVEQKIHCLYFEDYFGALNAKVIVIEEEYIDRDYLEDYAGYYVRCFKEYPRSCSRLHFFTIDFGSVELDLILQGDKDAIDLQKDGSYLGFIVVKPLPQTVIGRTCLQTYPSDNGRRHFPSLREYKANLFGISLSIKSLAFQEQDTVVAACATSALWTAFHGTGKLFQHSIPSPVEITKMAVESGFDDPRYITRTFPNQGLTINQMAHAIKCVRLEYFHINLRSVCMLKSVLYAYLRGKIPILFGAYLFDVSLSNHTCKGKHAITITGYSLGGTNPDPKETEQLKLKALRIDKIYVHDDQVGPFARMKFDGFKVEYSDGNGSLVAIDSLSTSWPGQNRQMGSIRAVPDMLLIPVYPKIRIPVEAIYVALIDFDFYIEELRQKQKIPYNQRIEWDIYLTTVNDLKEDIHKNDLFRGKAKWDFLTTDLPHFLWRATAMSGEMYVFDLLFDATDIIQGDFLIYVIKYDHLASAILKATCEDADMTDFPFDLQRILKRFL